MKYSGSCHCGAIKFTVIEDGHLEVVDCNCSICSKSGFLHLIVPKKRFELLQGEEELITYRFNTGIAQHYFCRICGTKPFYIPRSNPEEVDVNLRCLDDQPEKVTIVPFDGQNWEQNAHHLAHKNIE